MAMAFIQWSEVMKQDCKTNDVVELGRVSADTRGGVWIRLDTENSLSMVAGLADD